MDIPPCRIYGIMARDASVAVLFRRGPSNYVQLIRWDTARDEFSYGQWLHGRIYERRSDLSPDGNLLVYFAANWGNPAGCANNPHSWTTLSWTAISRPPYLTALSLWYKGDAWNGGGLFDTNERLGLNNGGTEFQAPEQKPPFEVYDLNLGQGEDSPIAYVRDARDGWGEDRCGWVSNTVFEHIWHKTVQNVVLWRILSFKHSKFETMFLAEGADIDLSGAEWADWDQRNRLVYAVGGALFVADFNQTSSPQGKQIADFNDQRFQAIKSPAWAAHW